MITTQMFQSKVQPPIMKKYLIKKFHKILQINSLSNLSNAKNHQRKNLDLEKLDESHKKKVYTGLTILENKKKYLPEDVSRDYIKQMVYNTLGNSLDEDSKKYVKRINFTI